MTAARELLREAHDLMSSWPGKPISKRLMEAAEMMGKLVAELIAAQNEMHSRELHHFETEKRHDDAIGYIANTLNNLADFPTAWTPDDVRTLLTDILSLLEEKPTTAPCPTCTGPIRETTNMICQTCGTDYSIAPAGGPTAQR